MKLAISDSVCGSTSQLLLSLSSTTTMKSMMIFGSIRIAYQLFELYQFSFWFDSKNKFNKSKNGGLNSNSSGLGLCCQNILFKMTTRFTMKLRIIFWWKTSELNTIKMASSFRWIIWLKVWAYNMKLETSRQLFAGLKKTSALRYTNSVGLTREGLLWQTLIERVLVIRASRFSVETNKVWTKERMELWCTYRLHGTFLKRFWFIKSLFSCFEIVNKLKKQFSKRIFQIWFNHSCDEFKIKKLQAKPILTRLTLKSLTHFGLSS